MGFLKNMKDKSVDLGKKTVEKGAEVGTKAYDGTKDAAKKGHDKAKGDKEDKE
ncbi:MAG: hypothetical protein PVG43_03090 [Nitrosopumilaceae archaeon]|jgi:hypothetical protein